MRGRPLKGKRILVVEDVPLLAEAVKDLFEQEGATVIGSAHSLKHALKLVDRAPDLAVVDVDLNGEASYPLIDALNERGTKVIVITGYGFASNLHPNTIAVLKKPFKFSVLATQAALALEGRRQSS